MVILGSKLMVLLATVLKEGPCVRARDILEDAVSYGIYEPAYEHTSPTIDDNLSPIWRLACICWQVLFLLVSMPLC
jgi:hypothetical protein